MEILGTRGKTSGVNAQRALPAGLITTELWLVLEVTGVYSSPPTPRIYISTVEVLGIRGKMSGVKHVAHSPGRLVTTE